MTWKTRYDFELQNNQRGLICFEMMYMLAQLAFAAAIQVLPFCFTVSNYSFSFLREVPAEVSSVEKKI